MIMPHFPTPPPSPAFSLDRFNPDDSFIPGSSPAIPDGSSVGLEPVLLAAHSLAGSTTTASNAVADSGGTPVSFRTRSGAYFSERAGDTRMSRSISSRSRRAASMSSSTHPLVPATRGLGLGSLSSRALFARASSGASRLALPSSPSVTPGVGSADTYRGRNVPRGSSLSLSLQQQQQQQHDHHQQQQHPLAGYPLRVPARHAGSGGRADGGRPSVHRLASGGREAWRAPAAAYNAAERRTGRDNTALRAVSARLDAAATAIDAVEIGVRSASDSLDSLLQLLESRPASAVTPGATTSNRGSSGGSSSGGGGGASSPPEEASFSMAGAVPGDLSGDISASPRSAVASREAAPLISARGAEAGGGLRAANMLRRELIVSLPPPADHSQTEEQVNADEQNRGTVSHSISHRADSSAAEDPAATRDALVGEAKEEPTRPARLGERSNPVCASPHLAPSPRRQEIVEEPTSSTTIQGQATRGHHGIGTVARSAPTTRASGEDGGDHGPPRSSQSSESTRPSPRAVRAAGSNTSLSATEVETETNRDSSLPLLELEVAMSGIDAERGRLVLEIARLRGQQNQSLVQLQRLQHEQFIVRQRQVSTLSDIVNSFGRTVEAAGALPHGEDSSLGRISNDVVSTLRRMLRLLSATVPSDATAPGARSTSPTLASLPPSTTETTAAAATADDTSRSGSAASSTGTYSVGGRIALRPTGGDLTQEVIDAALQALPRLAAAATAISGARRVQGYLAGLGGGTPDAPDERRSCSKETIAALPDAPPYATGVVGGASDSGGVRGCVICLSEDSTTEELLCRLPCDHVFHRACVGKWLSMQDSCPTCRSQVPNVKIGSPAPTSTPVV